MLAFSDLDVCSRSSSVWICPEISVSVWRIVTIIWWWMDYINGAMKQILQKNRKSEYWREYWCTFKTKRKRWKYRRRFRSGPGLWQQHTVCRCQCSTVIAFRNTLIFSENRKSKKGHKSIRNNMTITCSCYKASKTIFYHYQTTKLQTGLNRKHLQMTK